MESYQGWPGLWQKDNFLKVKTKGAVCVRTWFWVPSSSGHCHWLSLHQLDVPSHKDRSRCPRASSNPAAVSLSSISLMPTQACEETLRMRLPLSPPGLSISTPPGLSINTHPD